MGGVIFLEERSAQAVAEALVDRMDLGRHLVLVAHEGKSDLERSFARKIQAWRHPAGARFVVSRDNDGSNCLALKAKLMALVPPEFHPRMKIRIVMQELESWYFGDMEALEASGLLDERDARRVRGQARFREPDRLTNPSALFKEICRSKGKIGSARAIGPYLSLAENRSASFHHFLQALRWAAAD